VILLSSTVIFCLKKLSPLNMIVHSLTMRDYLTIKILSVVKFSKVEKDRIGLDV